jgi:hypothetical protein
LTQHNKLGKPYKKRKESNKVQGSITSKDKIEKIYKKKNIEEKNKTQPRFTQQPTTRDMRSR